MALMQLFGFSVILLIFFCDACLSFAWTALLPFCACSDLPVSLYSYTVIVWWSSKVLVTRGGSYKARASCWMCCKFFSVSIMYKFTMLTFFQNCATDWCRLGTGVRFCFWPTTGSSSGCSHSGSRWDSCHYSFWTHSMLSCIRWISVWIFCHTFWLLLFLMILV